MRFVSFILLGLGCLPVLAAAASPEEAANSFFTARLAADASLGAPGGLELARYSTWLGPELVCLLGAARRYNDAVITAQPEVTPPFSRHDLYSGGDALPTRFSLDPARVSGARATVRAHFEYEGEDGATASRSETLHMAIEKRRWVISDVEYGSTPAFRLDRPTLRAGLRAALDHANPSIGWDARQLDGCPLGGELARLQAEKKRPAQAAAVSGAKSKSKTARNTRNAKAGSGAKATTTPRKSASAAKKPVATSAKKAPASTTKKATAPRKTAPAAR
ncbi:MAG: hypothetical protein REI09_13825 [Candidatus Dactylopiibacterium sp.]|nr:hypothetical protein [Candidatus Dactylopiibacterium sp.]